MTTVIKVGGRLVEEAGDLARLCDRLAATRGPLVVVHGGGVMADKLCHSLGIETGRVEGRRPTGEDVLAVTVMVYAGWLNKCITAALRARGVDACGLSGCDGGVVTARRRVSPTVDWGFVGDVEGVNVTFIEALLARGMTPVISPVTLGDGGELLNSNADGVATAIAAALAAVRPTGLLFCLDRPGVQVDPADPSSPVIPLLTREGIAAARASGSVSDGMLPKLESALRAADAGVDPVRLIHPADLGNPASAGTRIASHE
jgi:acetylglutamate kinase